MLAKLQDWAEQNEEIGKEIEILPIKGPFKCYVTQLGVGGVKFSEK